MIASSELEYEIYPRPYQNINSDAENCSSSRTWIGRADQTGKRHHFPASSMTVQMTQIFSKFQAAKAFCDGVGADKIRKAAVEATRILNSGIFPDFLEPHVSVDAYGEFSISLRRPSGYLDIGVCGDGELSYHVRNDFDSSKTAYGDVPWDGATLPDELIKAAIQLAAQ